MFADNIHVSQVSTSLGADLSRAEVLALQFAAATEPGERRASTRRSTSPSCPRSIRGSASCKSLHAHDAAAERARVAQLARVGPSSLRSAIPGALSAQAPPRGGLARRRRLARQIDGIFGPLSAITQSEAALEAAQAGRRTRRPSRPTTLPTGHLGDRDRRVRARHRQHAAADPQRRAADQTLLAIRIHGCRRAI